MIMIASRVRRPVQAVTSFCGLVARTTWTKSDRKSDSILKRHSVSVRPYRPVGIVGRHSSHPATIAPFTTRVNLARRRIIGQPSELLGRSQLLGKAHHGKVWKPFEGFHYNRSAATLTDDAQHPL